MKRKHKAQIVRLQARIAYVENFLDEKYTDFGPLIPPENPGELKKPVLPAAEEDGA